MESYFNKIFSSEAFADQKIYQDLLRILVAHSIKNEIPKEINIAIEIFGKKSDYDPSTDSTVRVYIHNLRKKLRDYYQKQGMNDCIKLSIPKGSYKVEFQESYNERPKFNIKILVLAAACLSILFASIIWMVIANNNKGRISKNSLFWGELLRNEQKTKIVFGDHYFFKGYINGEAWNIRDIDVNSDQEFEEYFKKISTEHVTLAKYRKSYLPTRTPWCAVNLSSVFMHHHLPFELEISSLFQWNQINNKNIVYAGSFRALGILHNMLHDRFRYNTNDQGITILSDSAQTEQKFFASDHEHYPFVDYALVVKQPGPRESLMYFFVSTHDIGAIQITRMFTDIKNLEKFETEYLDEKQIKYFEAVFEVKGFSHSSMEHRLVYFNEIKK
ncbi:winged helix-turn-helix domain-containing protein [candidate division KSB1 bacterium]|nr:winged helix-turn-helix domain-containing protein [candidate division KSB1 bacterium]